MFNSSSHIIDIGANQNINDSNDDFNPINDLILKLLELKNLEKSGDDYFDLLLNYYKNVEYTRGIKKINTLINKLEKKIRVKKEVFDIDTTDMQNALKKLRKKIQSLNLNSILPLDLQDIILQYGNATIASMLKQYNSIYTEYKKELVKISIDEDILKRKNKKKLINHLQHLIRKKASYKYQRYRDSQNIKNIKINNSENINQVQIIELIKQLNDIKKKIDDKISNAKKYVKNQLKEYKNNEFIKNVLYKTIQYYIKEE